ncbi:nucleotidyltransferase family protein [Gammaproteobacteria bacterium]|nr:nucleotidyltransferase family protein [Gammaproteobacteria bacterium]
MSYEWKNVLLGPDATLRDALLLIDAEGLRIALVVDSEQNLLGAVTDGDIRRSLLKNMSLEQKVSNSMNKNPLISDKHATRNDLVNLMQKHNILSIPIVDNGRLIGLEELHSSSDKTITIQNPVFIMAGGFGKRLSPLTDNCPKPLLKLGDQPLLEIQLEHFISAGFNDFYISTHYLPEMIKNHFGDGSKWNVNIQYIHEEKPLGTGGALGLLPKNIPQLPMIMINGDILTKVNFRKMLDFHNDRQSSATMCIRDYEVKIPFGVIQGEDGSINSMLEKPVYSYFINTGIYIINPEIIKNVSQNKHIDMPNVLENCINKGFHISMFPMHEYWLDIGNMKDFEKAQQAFKDGSFFYK